MARLIPEAAARPDNTYYNVRRAQARIVRLQEYYSGELFDLYQRESFIRFARRLASKYFHKSQDLGIYQDIIQLYRLFLVMAPITEKIKNSMHLSWTRSNVLSVVRTHANGRRKRFYYAVQSEDRVRDTDRLRKNLRALGVLDVPFTELLVESFRMNYGFDGVRGYLANALFDPIMFLSAWEGFGVRVSRRFHRLEKRHFDGAVDLRETYGDILDYRVKYEQARVNGKLLGTVKITLSEAAMKAFRSEVSEILKSGARPAYKVLLIDHRVRSRVESFRYAKDGFDQLLELRSWLAQKVRRLSANYIEAKKLPDRLFELWRMKRVDSLYLPTPNIFWDYQKAEEDLYVHYFSPYRER